MKQIILFLVILVFCSSCKIEPQKELKKPSYKVSDTILKTKTADELRLIRNEVFARKGYVFMSDDLNSYFKSKEWYRPVSDTIIELSNEEKAYVNKIKAFELTLNTTTKNTIKTNREQQKDTVSTNKIKEKSIVYKGIIDTTFTYKDASGTYSLSLRRGEFKQSLYGYCVQKDSLTTELKWSLRDFVNEQEATEDYQMIFLKSYMRIKDLDKDGLIEPILVYTTRGYDVYEKSRLKIIVRHKNKKIAIRHQNALQDDERETKIDEAYNDLPLAVKDEVKSIIQSLIDNKIAVFNSDVLGQIGG